MERNLIATKHHTVGDVAIQNVLQETSEGSEGNCNCDECTAVSVCDWSDDDGDDDDDDVRIETRSCSTETKDVFTHESSYI